MNIGTSNIFSQLFPKTGKNIFPTTNGTQNSNPNAKAIADLLSGRRKNSYGVEGMRITGRSDWKKIINISDEMKQHVYEGVKKEFYKYGGMSGDSVLEHNAYYDKIHSYVKTLNAKDRSSATWTVSQLHLELAHRVNQSVKEKIPSWTSGQPIPHEILDEIFADDSLLQNSVSAISGNKELNMTI